MILSERKPVGLMRERISDTVHTQKDMDHHFDYANETSITDKKNILLNKLKLVGERQAQELKQNRLLNSKIIKLRRQFVEDQNEANKEQEQIDLLAHKIHQVRDTEIEAARRTQDVRNLIQKYEIRDKDDQHRMELIRAEKTIVANNVESELQGMYANIMKNLKKVRMQRYELRRLEKKKEIYRRRHRECFEAFAEQRGQVKIIEEMVALKLIQDYN